MEQPQGHSARFAPPTATVADVSTEAYELGGRGVRLAAAVVDGLIMWGLMFVAMKFMPVKIDPEAGLALIGWGLVAVQLFTVGAFLAVNGWFLATRGQTIGKMLLGLRIVRSDGAAASPGKVIGLRYGLCWLIALIPFVGGLFGLIDALMIFRADRRCLHDLIADTIVVKT